MKRAFLFLWPMRYMRTFNVTFGLKKLCTPAIEYLTQEGFVLYCSVVCYIAFMVILICPNTKTKGHQASKNFGLQINNKNKVKVMGTKDIPDILLAGETQKHISSSTFAAY